MMNSTPKPLEPRWRGLPSHAPAGAGPSSRKRTKVVVLTVLVLVLVGVVAGLLYWIRPIHTPYFLAAWVDQNVDPQIPVNPWAPQDREALRALPWEDQNAFASQSRHRLVSELSGLSQRGNQPVVVFLSALALTDTDGEVFLLPADAHLENPRTWLPLREVFTQLRACPSSRKLLLLDIMHPFTDPRAGLLLDDVAGHVDDAVKDALTRAPDLQVFCACAPGQVSLSSEVLRSSAFAHYVRDGLAGQADGYLPGVAANGQVSVRELAAFVTARVDFWARRTRGSRQTPVLHVGPQAGDFTLVGVRASSPSPALPSPREYPGWLLAGWKLRDGWSSWLGNSWSGSEATSFARVPVPLFRTLDEALLRSEQHWRGGTGTDRIHTFLKPDRQRFQDRQEELQRNQTRFPPRSLAEERARGAIPPELTEDLRLQFRELAALDARARVPDSKDKEKLSADREALLNKKVFQGKPFPLAWVVFQLAREERNPSPEQVLFWNELYAAGQPAGSPGPITYAEMQALERLAGLAARFVPRREGTGAWPAEAARYYLQVAGLKEQVAAGNPQALPWIEGLRMAAEAERRQGEQALLGNEPGTGTTPLSEACRDYRVIQDRLRIVQKALLLRDDALALLPAYVPYLERQPGQEKDWQAAIRTTIDLRQRLSESPRPGDLPPPARFGEMERLANTLEDLLRKLGKPFTSAEVDRLIKKVAGGDSSVWQEMDARLACAWLNGPQRKKLWTASQNLSRELHGEVLAGVAREARVPPAYDREKADSQELERGLLRARCSLALLKLASATDLNEVVGALDRAQQEPSDPAAWKALRERLRQTWRRLDRRAANLP
jgi:hypothetical protein